MTSIVIIEKGGDYKTVNANNLTDDDIYKKCGFRKPDNFGKRHEWKVKRVGEKYHIVLYARNSGKANTENKFDFPPPIDSELFFGNCAIVRYQNKEIIDFTREEWEDIYTKLMGGFEDLGGSDEDKKDAKADVDELENVPKKYLTKDGYLKDGFVVDNESDEDDDEEEDDGEEEDDDEEEDVDEEDEDEDEEEDDDDDNDDNEDVDDDLDVDIEEDEEDISVVSLTNNMENIKIKTNSKKKPKKKLPVKHESDSDMDYETDLSDELSEEAYEYSDD